jgi:transposase-like protein
MVNINKLKGRIVEHGMSVSELAQKIGIDTSTLYRKMASNGENFLIRDVDAIANELSLTGREVNAIFFSQIVA